MISMVGGTFKDLLKPFSLSLELPNYSNGIKKNNNNILKIKKMLAFRPHDTILGNYVSMLCTNDVTNLITWSTTSWGPSAQVCIKKYIYMYTDIRSDEAM